MTGSAVKHIEMSIVTVTVIIEVEHTAAAAAATTITITTTITIIISMVTIVTIVAKHKSMELDKHLCSLKCMVVAVIIVIVVVIIADTYYIKEVTLIKYFVNMFIEGFKYKPIENLQNTAFEKSINMVGDKVLKVVSEVAIIIVTKSIPIVVKSVECGAITVIMEVSVEFTNFSSFINRFNFSSPFVNIQDY